MRRNKNSHKHIGRMFLVTVILICSACNKDIADPHTLVFGDASLYVSLEMNHRAVLISTHSPYDTVTLLSRPIGSNGVMWRPPHLTDAQFDSILIANPATFISRDPSKVMVSKEGKVKAMGATGAGATVMVIATRQIQNVTRACTTYVRTLDIPNPPAIRSFKFSIADSNKVAAHSSVMPIITALDSANQRIDNVNTYYQSRDRKIVGFGSTPTANGRAIWSSGPVGSWNTSIRGVGAKFGQTLVVASAYVYGKSMTDSLMITSGYMIYGEESIVPLHLNNTVTQNPGYGPGATIAWINRSDRDVSISFDDPDKALEAESPYSSSGNGNILTLPADSNESERQRRYRRFIIPGVYKYRVEPFGYTGTFIIKDF